MFGDMVVRYMPNSDPWGPLETPFMTIFVFFVNPQIPNIEKNEACGSTTPGRYLIFFFIKFLFECRRNYVWRSIFDPSYDHIYKNIHVCKGKGREGEKREGREGKGREGRKEGRGVNSTYKLLTPHFGKHTWLGCHTR